MNFEDFIENGKVRRATKDVSLARALLKTAMQDMSFLDSLKITENSARKIMSYYGKDISAEETKENTKKIKKIIDMLIEKYLP